jgi:hypothetical protein
VSWLKSSKWGIRVAAVWFILTGASALAPAITGIGMISAILAIAAGVLILLDR